jgi:hypothetical protein
MSELGWCVFGAGFGWWWALKRLHWWLRDDGPFPPLPPAVIHETRWHRLPAWHIDPLMRHRLENTHS